MSAELIARLEKATGPDRTIDLELARLQGVLVMRRKLDGSGNEEHTYHHYTESIDSAMTLFPDEAYLPHIKLERSPDFGHQWHASYRRMYFGHAPNAAIALCIAALKAREIANR